MKKCIVCGNEATLCVKDCSECYCEECAQEYFDDIKCLTELEKQAQEVKKLIDNPE